MTIASDEWEARMVLVFVLLTTHARKVNYRMFMLKDDTQNIKMSGCYKVKRIIEH